MSLSQDCLNISNPAHTVSLILTQTQGNKNVTVCRELNCSSEGESSSIAYKKDDFFYLGYGTRDLNQQVMDFSK